MTGLTIVLNTTRASYAASNRRGIVCAPARGSNLKILNRSPAKPLLHCGDSALNTRYGDSSLNCLARLRKHQARTGAAQVSTPTAAPSLNPYQVHYHRSWLLASSISSPPRETAATGPARP